LRTPTAIPDEGISQGHDEGRSENHLAGVEEGVLLKLLIARRGLTVPFCGIYDATACNTLRFGRKANNPTEADDCYDREETGEAQLVSPIPEPASACLTPRPAAPRRGVGLPAW
jgi:hypothetical protein